MIPSIYSAMNKNDVLFRAKLRCAAVSLLLLVASSAHSQPIDADPDSALLRSISLQTQILDVSTHRSTYGIFDLELIDKLVQLAETQSSVGEYENAIRSLEEALQVSRVHNGLYHSSQIEIVDELIANATLLENWVAVNDLYDLEEHLFRRLFEPTDARLEIGLEKITAWHISAVNEDIDGNKQEHLGKLQELFTIRLAMVDNLLGSDNARYDYLLNNLANVEFELENLRKRRGAGVNSPGPQHTPTKSE